MDVQPGTPRGVLAVVVNHPQAPLLTPAERHVLAMLLEGCANATMARARARAQRTIANQVATLLRKFHVHSRAELAARIADLVRTAEVDARDRDVHAAGLALARLKPRQRQALTLRARGYSVKYIGYELGIAMSTASTELRNAMLALDIRSNLELCLFAAASQSQAVVSESAPASERRIARCASCAGACASCAKERFSSTDYAVLFGHS